MTRKLRVFDFDDTLAKTGSRIHISHGDGTSSALLPGEYAVYEPRADDEFDYTEFKRLIDPKEIPVVTNILRAVTGKRGAEGAIVLTARGSADPVEQFLDIFNLPPVEVIALGTSDPMAKADYVAKRIEEDELTHVEFFDDSEKNVEAVGALKDAYPEVNIVSRLMRYGTDEGKVMTLTTLRDYITEIVRASPEYMKKETVRQLIQDKVVAAVRDGTIGSQEDLDAFFMTADTGDETVAMAVDALRMIPLPVWFTMT